MKEIPNPIYRAEVSRQIITAHSLLFEDSGTVQEFEQFFTAAIHRQLTQFSLNYNEVNL